jgi:hypothetical protein
MVSYRPTGVTILAAFIIITYGLIFVLGLAILFIGISEISQVGFAGEFASVVGIFLLIWAFLRLSMGFGLLRMRRRAWRSAMIVFSIGLLIDLGITMFVAAVPGQVLLDVIVLVYLLAVRKHFIY